MRRLLLALAAVVFVVRAPLSAENVLFSRFADYLDSLRTQAAIPGLSAAIVGETDILWERALGQQDVARSIATRPDTPFAIDGLTQIFTASMVLACVEEGRLSLDDRVGEYKPDSPDANATLRQLLTHTSGPPNALAFTYRPERLEPLTAALATCTGHPFRPSLTSLLDRVAMRDSLPGSDVLADPTAAGTMSASTLDRYKSVLGRLAVPYAVDKKGHASASQYTTTGVTAATGLISTVRDLAKFDVALRSGVLLEPETLAAAWRAPVGGDGQPLPHGLGWFVQIYNGEPIVWQFGVSDDASSSLIITAPMRKLTLVVLANGDGLVRPFEMSAGDLLVSPFGRLFLGFFVR